MSLETNTPPTTTGYLLLFRSSIWDQHDFSDAEARQVMDKVHAWFDDLYATGKVIGAQPLLDEGTIISGKGGRYVTDDPFAEAKESIGGYVMLSVKTKEEALALAQSNPMHDY